ncbi:MAG: DUF5702 domain-containing protein [Alkaliphilus sp.]
MKSQRGALTAFLSITLTVMIFFSGTIVEGSRIRIADTQVKRALENATGSLLAGYNSKLKENYGLFALANADVDYVTSQISFFTNTTLNPETNLSEQILLIDYILNGQKHFWDLQDYSIDFIETNLYHSLNSNEVLENQILEFMKYRAPVQIASRFSIAEVQKTFQTITALNEIKRMKLRIDRQFAEVAIELEELDKQIKLANDFVKETVREAVNSLTDYIGEYKNSVDDRDSLLEQIEIIEEKIRNLAINEEEARESLEQELDELRYDLKESEKKIRGIDKKVGKQANNIDTELNNYLKRNKRIKSVVAAINRILIDLNAEVDSMEKSVRATADIDSNFKEMIAADIKNYRKIIEHASLDKVQNQALENEETINSCLILLSSIETYFRALTRSQENNRRNIIKSIDENRQLLKCRVNDYNNSIELSVPEQSLVGSEEYGAVREKIVKAVNSGLADILTQMDSKIVPEDVHNLLRTLNSQENLGFDEITVEFDEEKKSDGMTENMQGFGIGIIGKLSVARDVVYVNEYIMGMFKSAITQVDTETNFDENLRGNAKTERASFFDSEIEYVIFGCRNQKTNFNYAITTILGVRFVSNLVYVYTNPEMLKTASEKAKTAAALTGKFAVFTYPAVKALIMSAYAMKESVEDVDNLLKGESIPLIKIYKRALPAEESESSSIIELSYEDYLHIFLMTLVDQETKLDRISNLIQINMHEGELDNNFGVENYYTYIATNIKISIKNIFLNLVNIEEINTTKIGRHNLNITIMDGY